MHNSEVEYKRFVWELNNVIKINQKYKSVVFVCIGTTSISGDSFGPIVGTRLKNAFYRSGTVTIMGDVHNTVTYNNIEDSMNYIKYKYANSLIVVIDAALSDKKDVGKVFIQNRGLKYAESLNKHNNVIGNISIKAVVGEDTRDCIKNFKTLKEVPISKVEAMSNIVSEGIVEVMNKKENNGKNIYK